MKESAVYTAKPPLWTKSFILLIIGNLFIFMSFQMLLPTLPPQAKAIGASDIEIGLVTTLFSIAAVVIRPLIGFLLESAKRKWLVITGAVGLLFLTLSYSLTSIVFLFLIVRLLHGFAWGWSTTANGTAAVELVPTKRLGEGMGYYGLSITIGMIIAPSFGILLFQHLGFQPLIIGSAIFGVISIIALSLVQYKTPKSVLEKSMHVKDFSFFRSLIDKHGAFPALITLLSAFGYGGIVTFIVIFGQERGIDQIFLYYLCNALAATAVRPISGRWFDRSGPWLLAIVCSFLTFIAFWVLSFTYSVGMLVLAGILFGAGFGSLLPVLQSWVLSKTPADRRGVANGMYYSALDGGIGISAVFLGFLSSYVDLGTIFQLSSICFFIVILLVLIDYLKEKKKTDKRENQQVHAKSFS